MANFLAELKRRQVYRVAAAYAVVAWVLLQIVNNVAPGLNLPNSAVTLVIVLLAVGFPIALIFAWVMDLRPQSATASAQPAKAASVDWVLAGALLAVIAIFIYQQTATWSVPAPQTAQSALAPVAPVSRAQGIAIVVLPFVNLSGDAGQDFFSDGMTEEITTSLAKVPDLHVVGRSSAFQFKGQSRDLRTVGQALGASHVIEGSVRKAGNRVRITAELVRAETGLQLWSENYDRNLTDIFAIQEDIAQAIAGSLRVPLGLAQGETLVKNRAKDDATYEDYLRARSLIRARGYDRLAEAAALLEQVTARDPGFAPGWAQLALAYGYAPFYNRDYLNGRFEQWRRIVETDFVKADAAAKRAIELDGKSPEAVLALGIVQGSRENYAAGQALNARALALDPDNPEILYVSTIILADSGYLKEAMPSALRLRALEPFVPAYNSIVAWVLALNGKADDAIAILKPLASAGTGLGQPATHLARIYAEQGRYRESAETLQLIPDGIYAPGLVDSAARAMRNAPKADPGTPPLFGFLSFVYNFTGAPERVLNFREGTHKLGKWSPAYYYWSPAFANIRKSERWKTLMREAGFLDHWRDHGWPDLCRPVGADDFVCD